MPALEELEYRVKKAAEAKTLQLIAFLASLEQRFAGMTAEVRADLVTKTVVRPVQLG